MSKPALPEVCVVYLTRDTVAGREVLLGRKLTGLGRGKIVAPGGKLEVGESPMDAALREVREEVGISVSAKELELLGQLTYLFPTKPAWSQLSWAFRAHGDFGAPLASNELDSTWMSVDALPYDEMWDDAKHWVPDVLRESPVVATFEFGADLSTVAASYRQV